LQMVWAEKLFMQDSPHRWLWHVKCCRGVISYHFKKRGTTGCRQLGNLSACNRSASAEFHASFDKDKTHVCTFLVSVLHFESVFFTCTSKLKYKSPRIIPRSWINSWHPKSTQPSTILTKEFPTGNLSARVTYVLKAVVSRNRDVSGPMCIYNFYFTMVIQHILRIMKGNIESLCI
jgi:hypothetical protein